MPLTLDIQPRFVVSNSQSSTTYTVSGTGASPNATVYFWTFVQGRWIQVTLTAIADAQGNYAAQTQIAGTNAAFETATVVAGEPSPASPFDTSNVWSNRVTITDINPLTLIVLGGVLGGVALMGAGYYLHKKGKL